MRNLTLKEENYIIDAIQFLRSLENREKIILRFDYTEKDIENLRKLENKLNGTF